MDKLLRHIRDGLGNYLGFFKVLGILGPRQVGKTTFARQLMQQFAVDRQFVYIDLESTEDNRKLQDAETWLKQQAGKTVVIDEIQQRPELFSLLRSVADKSDAKGQFIILGSASPDIIRKASQTLAGRIHYIFLPPFSLMEVGRENLFAHWVRGGYPESWLAPTADLSMAWRRNYIDAFIYRDLAAMGFGITPLTMQKLLHMLAHLHGGLLSKANMANSLDVSNTLVNNYVDILTGAFMIRQLPAFHTNSGKRLVKAPKVYIADSGILHTLLYLGSYETLTGHPIAGLSWEGYVIEEIRKATANKWQYYFYRTHNGAECDLFCITDTGKKLAFEIKLSNSPRISKGFYQSIADLQPDQSYVVVPTVTAYQQKDGVTVAGLGEIISRLNK
ncbi:MAG: ATP-binding protein [Chitinophagaceae bacterium]|jgi:hypothetical protein|nr:ATP-binding protein [Chitinophagaceae bacterium]